MLPTRASLEYLRKLAKDRLTVLRETNPHAKLADALLATAHEQGFSSWRALKSEFDRLHGTDASRLFDAIENRDAGAVRTLLRDEPALSRARHQRHDASALHWAASCGDVGIVRMLLDAGADPNDAGDDARLGVIGWATFIHGPGEASRDIVSLLLERGARHHVFSAIASGDVDAVRTLIEQRPEVLDQRLAPRYHGQTALHFAITRRRLDILDLLIEMGADLDARDGNGQTALEYALLRGEGAAAERLRAEGALMPRHAPAPDSGRAAEAGEFAASIQKGTIVVGSRDVAATLAWYASIGFTEVARHPTEGRTVFWGMVRLGAAELTFDVREGTDARGVSLLLETDRVRDLYERLSSRQLGAADVQFVKTLHDPEHGGLEFIILDPNGLKLRFFQPTP